jgi:hypothetical protein
MERCYRGGGTGITSGTATCNLTNYTGKCTWLKAGNIVCVDLKAVRSSSSSGSYANIIFTGLPKPVNDITFNYSRYSTGNEYSYSKYAGEPPNMSNEAVGDYKLTIDGTLTVQIMNTPSFVFMDHFVYISSE